MSRKSIDKALCLYIERILIEYTDELSDGNQAHALSVTEIKDLLEKLYNFEVSPDLIRSCLDALDRFYSTRPPADCSEWPSSIYQLERLSCNTNLRANKTEDKAANTKKLYQLVNVQLQLSSLRHILALLQRVSHAGDVRNVVKELLASRSMYERQALNTGCSEKSTRPSDILKLERVLFDVDIIEDAIQNHKLLTLHYGSEKTAITRSTKATQKNEKQYDGVIPYWVALDDGYYYLYCKAAGFRDISILRIDKISSLTSIEPPDEYEWPENYQEMQALAKERLRASINRMPSRNNVDVILRCHDKKDEKHIYENFGNKEGFKYIGGSADEKGSVFTFKVSFDGMKYWVLKHLSTYEVIKPIELREAIKEEIKHNCYNLKVEE